MKGKSQISLRSKTLRKESLTNPVRIQQKPKILSPETEEQNELTETQVSQENPQEIFENNFQEEEAEVEERQQEQQESLNEQQREDELEVEEEVEEQETGEIQQDKEQEEEIQNTKKEGKKTKNIQFLLDGRIPLDTQAEEYEIELEDDENNNYSDGLSVGDEQLMKEISNQDYFIGGFNEKNYYTLVEDLQILLLVKIWDKEKMGGNPFKDKFIEAYTKLKGRSASGLRDRYRKYLKNLTQENIIEMRKALNELGPRSFCHFEKKVENQKETRILIGVFREPQNVIQQAIKQLDGPLLPKKLLQLQKIQAKSDFATRLERKYYLSQLEKEQEKENYYQQENKENYQKNSSVQVSPQIHQNQKEEFRTPFSKRSNNNYDSSNRLSGSSSMNSETSSARRSAKSLNERLSWLTQMEREFRYINMQVPILSRTKVILRGNDIKKFIGTNKGTKKLIGERFSKSRRPEQEEEEGKLNKRLQCDNIKISGYDIGYRTVNYEHCIAPAMKRKLEEYAHYFSKDIGTILKDLASVSGDFDILREYYINNQCSLVWLPYEDQILQKYHPNDYQFKLILHNKGYDHVAKRLKFLAIDKRF